MTSPEPITGEDQALLRRLLQRTSGAQFRLVILSVWTLRTQAALCAWLTARAVERGFPVQTIDLRNLPGHNLLEELRAQREDRRGGLLIILGLDESAMGSESMRPDFLRQLNVQRDLLVRDIAAIWVVLGHPSQIARLKHDAPDFADYALLWLNAAEPEPPARNTLEGKTAPAPARVRVAGEPMRLQPAWSDFFRGAWDQALDRLDASALNEPYTAIEQASAARLRAEVERSRGAPDAALNLLQSALDRLDDAHGGDRSKVMRSIATIMESQGHIQGAFELLTDALHLATEAEDSREIAAAQVALARIHARRGDLAKARALNKAALATFTRSGDAHSQAIALGEVARIYTSEGNYDEALRLHTGELAVYEKTGDARSQAITLGDIAHIHSAMDRIEEALQLRRREASVYQGIGDVQSRAIALGEIARLLNRKGEPDEALRLHAEQLQVLKTVGDVRSTAITLCEIARIVLSKGDHAEALRIFSEQMKVFTRIGDTSAQGVTMGDIARILSSQGAQDEARRLHEERLALSRNTTDLDGMCNAIWDLANLDLQKGDHDSAITRLREALDIALRIHRTDAIAATASLLGQLSLVHGDLQQALHSLSVARQAAARQGNGEDVRFISTLLDRAKGELAR